MVSLGVLIAALILLQAIASGTHTSSGHQSKRPRPELPLLPRATTPTAIYADGAAANTWLGYGDNMAAVSPDCPYTAHGDGNSLPGCFASCIANPQCNFVNADVSSDGGDCVHRLCTDPAHANVTRTMDYSGWGLLRG